MPELQRDPWFYATWEGNEIATLLAGARLTLPEKLQWLEDACRMAEYFEGRRVEGRSVEAKQKSGPEAE